MGTTEGTRTKSRERLVTLKIGSLFSGYGGLDLGVMSVLDSEVAWHCEFDDAPSSILEHHWPTIPNYRDVRDVDWNAVEPVDILTGGFPCQDVSLAGNRRGLKEGTRSGLWSEFAKAIEHIEPRLVIIENVRGLLSARADSGVEYPRELLDYAGTRPLLNAASAVLGDLADLGFDARWATIRASDAGAAHRRERVFIVAYPNSVRGGRWSSSSGGCQSGREFLETWVADNGHGRNHPTEEAQRANTDGVGLSLVEHGGRPRRSDGEPQSLTPTLGEVAANSDDSRELGQVSESRRGPSPRTNVRMSEDGTETTSDSGRSGRPQGSRTADGRREEEDGSSMVDERRPDYTQGIQWGDYRVAIERWERTIGRPAPAPTVDKKLNPVFVEWLMGLEPGWVTNPDIGIKRNDQLKALGNGVVPQQASLALKILL